MTSIVLRFPSKLGGVALAAAIGLASPATPVLAQANSVGETNASTTSTVTVTAPRVTRRKAGPVEVLSLSRGVDFADLDLTTHAGVDEFYKRIMYAAIDACDRLETEYPSNIYLPVPATQNCADSTATAALATAKEIVAAARTK